MYFHAATNKYFSNAAGFVIGDTQYPAGWIEANPDALAGIGLTLVSTSGARDDDRFFDNAEVMEAGVITITNMPRDLALVKNEFKDQIDQACGAKRAAAVSQGDYISEEYRRAYEDALAYQAAGYAGAVPNSVQSWKDASGMTAQAAADDIIATRDMYMALLDAVRSIRLNGKAAVDAAATPDAIIAALDTVNASLAALP